MLTWYHPVCCVPLNSDSNQNNTAAAGSPAVKAAIPIKAWTLLFQIMPGLVKSWTWYWAITIVLAEKNTVFKLSNFVQCHSRRDSCERECWKNKTNYSKLPRNLSGPGWLCWCHLAAVRVSKPFIVSNWCRFCFLFMKTFLVYVTFIQLHFCLDPPRPVLRPGGRQPVQQ